MKEINLDQVGFYELQARFVKMVTEAIDAAGFSVFDIQRSGLGKEGYGFWVRTPSNLTDFDAYRKHLEAENQKKTRSIEEPLRQLPESSVEQEEGK